MDATPHTPPDASKIFDAGDDDADLLDASQDAEVVAADASLPDASQDAEVLPVDASTDAEVLPVDASTDAHISDAADAGPVCPTGDAVRVVALAIGEDGQPGHGLDLDGNASTCSPASSCSGGIDNALAPLSAIFNASLADSLTAAYIPLFEPRAISFLGDPFLLGWDRADLDPASSSCDSMTELCNYLVRQDCVDEITCEPVERFLDATLNTNQLLAGESQPPDLTVVLVFGGYDVPLVIHQAHLVATTTIADDAVSGLAGVLGGGVRRDELLAALGELPSDALPVPLSTIAAILGSLVEDDLDLDGNGSPDAASIGLVLSGIRATITGVAP